MPDLHRIFDINLSSDFPLPELPLVASQGRFQFGHKTTEEVDPEPVVTVRLEEGSPGQFDSRGFAKVFEWCDYDGKVICWVERQGDEYLYVFARGATFHISSRGLISCFLQDGSTMQLLRHLLLNQIIPRYLASTGRLLLHASAVALENGKSVAFLGNSGFGKSTLVSSFHRNGARLINDDCILLECSENGVNITGGVVSIRLFPDSVNAVFSEAAGFTNYTDYTDKQQLFLNGEPTGAKSDPCVLDALFLLNDPREEPADEDAAQRVCIETVSGSEAMMAMIYSTFSLDPSDKTMITHNFQNIGQAINGRLALYRLRYPRVHRRLPEVRMAVIERVS